LAFSSSFWPPLLPSTFLSSSIKLSTVRVRLAALLPLPPSSVTVDSLFTIAGLKLRFWGFGEGLRDFEADFRLLL
jgi:hypothetical protein